MRYPIILLAILALAVAAGTSLADCPDADTVYAASCGHLPVYGDEIDHDGCTHVDWTFEFTRTMQTTGRCKVIVKIEGTSFTPIIIDSGDYSAGPHVISGSGVISGSPIQGTMRHLTIQATCGLFANLRLSYNIYEE